MKRCLNTLIFYSEMEITFLTCIYHLHFLEGSGQQLTYKELLNLLRERRSQPGWDWEKKHWRNTERQRWGRKRKQHDNWNSPRHCKLKKKVIIPKRKAVTSADHLGQQKAVCIFFRSTNQMLFIWLWLSLTLFSREHHMLYYIGNSPSG